MAKMTSRRSCTVEIHTGRTSTATISHEEVLAVKIARREVLGVVLTKDQGWSFAKRTPREGLRWLRWLRGGPGRRSEMDGTRPRTQR